MAEPEEETDEEWHRIANAVDLIEKQFLRTNISTPTNNTLLNTPTNTVHLPPIQPPIQPPTPIPFNLTTPHETIRLQYQARIQTLEARLSTPSPHILARQKELEALLEGANKARRAAEEKLSYAQHELTLVKASHHTHPVPTMTQPSDVVEGTQVRSGMELLKSSLRPPRRRKRERREREREKEDLVQVVWGVRGGGEFCNALLRNQLFVSGLGDRIMAVCVRYRLHLLRACVVRGIGCDDWSGVPRQLAPLLDVQCVSDLSWQLLLMLITYSKGCQAFEQTVWDSVYKRWLYACERNDARLATYCIQYINALLNALLQNALVQNANHLSCIRNILSTRLLMWIKQDVQISVRCDAYELFDTLLCVILEQDNKHQQQNEAEWNVMEKILINISQHIQSDQYDTALLCIWLSIYSRTSMHAPFLILECGASQALYHLLVSHIQTLHVQDAVSDEQFDAITKLKFDQLERRRIADVVRVCVNALLNVGGEGGPVKVKVLGMIEGIVWPRDGWGGVATPDVLRDKRLQQDCKRLWHVLKKQGAKES